jgi:hypothetical protein
VSSMIAAIRLQSRMWRIRKNMDIRVIRDIGDIVLLTIRLQTNKLSESDLYNPTARLSEKECRHYVGLPHIQSTTVKARLSDCQTVRLLDCKIITFRLSECQSQAITLL